MSYALKNITGLNSITDIEKAAKALALADAILMPDWEYRYFSFNSNWDGNHQEMLASMRDGTGREYYINFSSSGVVGKVYDEVALPDLRNALSLIPNNFTTFKEEPAFNLDRTTFLFWREKDDSAWKAYPSNLNNYPLLGFLVGGVEKYHCWAESYYERSIDLGVLKSVFLSLTVTAEQLLILNPEIELADLADDLQEIF